jgi:hypothetical protein
MIWLPLLIGVPLFLVFRKHTLAQWLAYLAGLGYFIVLMVWWISTPSTPMAASPSAFSDTAMAVIWILGGVLTLALLLAGYLAIRLWLAGGFRSRRRRINYPAPAVRNTALAPTSPTPPGTFTPDLETDAAQQVYVEMIRQMPGILRELVIREQLQREAAYNQQNQPDFLYPTSSNNSLADYDDTDDDDSNETGSSSLNAPEWF